MLQGEPAPHARSPFIRAAARPAPDDRTDWGAPVVITDCRAARGQIWTYREDGSLYNPASDTCLELPGWEDANGTALGVWRCYGNPNQRWTTFPNTA